MRRIGCSFLLVFSVILFLVGCATAANLLAG